MQFFLPDCFFVMSKCLDILILGFIGFLGFRKIDGRCFSTDAASVVNP